MFDPRDIRPSFGMKNATIRWPEWLGNSLMQPLTQPVVDSFNERSRMSTSEKLRGAAQRSTIGIQKILK